MKAAGRGVAAILVVLGGRAAGQSVPAPQPTPAPRPQTWAIAGADSLAWRQALQELAAAGSPLSQAEEALLSDGASGDPAAGGSARAVGRGGSSGGSGVLVWSADLPRGEPVGAGGRLDLRQGAYGVLVRRIGDRGQERIASATAWRQTPRLTAAAGGMALTHGFGLLSGEPGRTGSLGAGASLGPPRAGWRWWPYPAEGPGLEGFGAGVQMGGLQIQGLIGRPERPAADCAPATVILARMAWTAAPDGDRVSLLVARAGAERGASLAAGVRRAGIHGNAEAAVWDPASRGEPSVAAMADFGVKLGDLAAMGGAIGCGRGEAGSPLAARPPVLAGWWGHGWAWRGALTPQRGLALRLLAGGALCRDVQGEPGRKRRDVLEAECDCPLPPPYELSIRWRRQGETVWVWSERFPWLAALPEPLDETVLLSLNLARTGSSGSFSAGLRSWRATRQGSLVQRTLLTCGGRRRLGARWIARANWAAAWGGDGDLVSACSPYAGLLVPRHWGDWSNETMLGLETVPCGWQAKIAASRRLRAAHSPGADDLALWIEVSLRW